MPDVRRCAIYGCKSNSRDHKTLKFFNFPARESPVYQIWLDICIESKEILQAIRRPYICSTHFHENDVGFRRLATGAVPALLLSAPPGFAEEERAKALEKEASEMEKQRLAQLINDTVFVWAKRAHNYSNIGGMCTARRALRKIGLEVRNFLGATLTVSIDDYWLRKFRHSHLKNWDEVKFEDVEIRSLDLLEIIKELDPTAKIYNEEEIAALLEEEHKRCSEMEVNKSVKISKKKSKHGAQGSKRKYSDSFSDYYGGSAHDESYSNQTVEIKSEEQDSVDLSQEDDDGCFDVYSEDSGQEVRSEITIESYQQALEHLKPLEDFALRQENYRAIGLLSTLEIIFKKPRK